VARAKATFDVRARPVIGNAAPVLAPEARVAAGAVFYVDGHGVVRRLAVDAQPVTVTTLPGVTAQTELSFAVSPDGTLIVASLFTYPPTGPPCSFPCNPFQPGKPFVIDIITAGPGSAATAIRHEERPQTGGVADIEHVPQVVGWIDAGALLATDATTGAQDIVGERTWQGDVFLMSATGKAGAALGGTGCRAFTWRREGMTVCAPSGGSDHPTIRDATGAVQWTAAKASGYTMHLALSPDASRIALEDRASDQRIVLSRSGPQISLPAKFHPEGWLDADTLIGVVADSPGALQGEMSLVRLSDPGKVVGLGFVGSFVGVVQGG
jgi:hypothetical protein